MKITIDVDFTNETIFITDEITKQNYDASPVGHPFLEVCPDHIGYSLNNFLRDNWNTYLALINNPEYKTLEKKYDEKMLECARTHAQVEDLIAENKQLQKKLDEALVTIGRMT
jgi:hypothetical protein